MVPRLKTISLQTLLLARNKLPLRSDDRMEQVLVRFRVPFDAAATSRVATHLMQGKLVFWFFEGLLNSLELTAPHEPSDLINWCGFDWAQDRDRLLHWCQVEGIPLDLMVEAGESQLWQSPSGALLSVHERRLWNVTLDLFTPESSRGAGFEPSPGETQ
ncbi:hypothetical protein [Deinococcus multiflagellatus]|uniref:Uncharacterized protein n=1 Tax=Deinococcus multiflagellatus TaxID=1656887 RepID=A0ABW1ZFR9_9DEIO|nr:hypothetical protein [Deinococcus multiflagellatus]MBZ9711840.1 hypothetical protein [Deinococcus multiflagellatus]